jgi:hypothetical protein
VTRIHSGGSDGRSGGTTIVHGRSLRCAAFGLACLTFSLAEVRAQDSFTGSWKIEKSEPAPWAKTADMLDAGEIRRLVGGTVEFKAAAISGPAPLACKGPHYEVARRQADEIFQGALAEYGDPSTTPDRLADRIGFGKRPIVSLATGCAADIEFHALDADHAIFALNNSLYRLTRTKAAGN